MAFDPIIFILPLAIAREIVKGGHELDHKPNHKDPFADDHRHVDRDCEGHLGQLVPKNVILLIRRLFGEVGGISKDHETKTVEDEVVANDWPDAGCQCDGCNREQG